MLWAASELKGLSIAATDGAIGTVSDILFDDKTWRMRWLVVDTGNWLPGRLVLLHPSALGQPDKAKGALPVSLTREKVEASPDIQQDLPVSHQMEQGVFAYYGWDPLWGGGAFGMDAMAVPMAPVAAGLHTPGLESGEPDDLNMPAHEGDPHLRSLFGTSGHRIHASDGEIGHSKDFLVDTESWSLRYMVVDTGHWLPGRKVLLAPAAITAIDWVDQSITVAVTIAQVKASPEWSTSQPMDAGYEERLRGHYDWPPFQI